MEWEDQVGRRKKMEMRKEGDREGIGERQSKLRAILGVI